MYRERQKSGFQGEKKKKKVQDERNVFFLSQIGKRRSEKTSGAVTKEREERERPYYEGCRNGEKKEEKEKEKRSRFPLLYVSCGRVIHHEMAMLFANLLHILTGNFTLFVT